MSAGPRFRLLYTYTGGLPPASFEELVVREDRAGEYVAGNPWPTQPPFDEIGLYARTLGEEEWRALEAVLEAVRASAPDEQRPLGHADAGIESLDALMDEARYSVAWTPHDVPDELRPAIAAVRHVISELREHPLSTLRAELEADGRLRLLLANRGRERFAFHWLDADERHRPEVRIELEDLDSGRAEGSPSPIRLLRREPVTVAPAAQLARENGESALQPGESVALELADDLDRGPAGVEVRCLVRVCFFRTGLDGRRLVEEGWLMPEPFVLPS